MTLEDFLARIYVDAEARAKFRADPQGELRRAGLANEIASLDRFDWTGLELASASFAHKRAGKFRPAILMRSGVMVFLIGLTFRFWLIYVFPIVFGGDTILHLANRDHILLSHQLPLLQVIIYAVSLVSENIVLMRVVMALIGAASGVAFYLLARFFASERSSLFAALLFTLNPFLVEISIVPFQETLMLACLLFALGYYFRERKVAAAIWLAAACMTRYEAWIFVPLIVLDTLRDPRQRTAVKVLSTGLLFGAAPLVWLTAHQGFSATGTFVVEWPHSVARFQRWAYLGWITLKNSPIPAMLAVSGAWRVYTAKLLEDRRVQLLAGALGLFLVTILFSAHGSAPDPERYVSSREAVLVITMTLLLAALGLDVIWTSKRSRIAVGLASLGLLVSVVDAHRVLRRDTSQPRLQLSYQLAQYLDRTLGPDEMAVIVATPNDTEGYLDKVRQREGETGVARARETMAGLDNSPVDCLRTIVHSRLGRARLSCSTSPSGARWVAIWKDSGAAAPKDRASAKRLENSGLELTVYR
jgi:hypothetical protein